MRISSKITFFSSWIIPGDLNAEMCMDRNVEMSSVCTATISSHG